MWVTQRLTASSMCPRSTACSTSGGGFRSPGVWSLASTGSGRNRVSEPPLDPLGRGDVLAHAELLRLIPEGQPHELRQVQDRQSELAPADLRRLRLLHVEVQVTE